MANWQTDVLCTVNSGLYLRHEAFSCLVDGLHADTADGFSNPPPALLQDLALGDGIFRDLDALLFTHLHADHHDAALTRQALALPCRPKLWSPEEASLQAEPAENGLLRVQLGHNATLWARNTVHDGARFADVPHQSFLLQLGEERFFIAGDALLGETDAAPFVRAAQGRIDAAFLNFYHISTPARRAFVQELAPERVILGHLPFPEDDKNGVIDLTRRMMAQLPANLPAQLAQPMQWL